MRSLSFFIVFCFAAFRCFSQAGMAMDSPDKLPSAEAITVHVNTTFFSVGETLLFNIFCRQEKHISTLSALAYVALIGSNGKPVSQMKVPLKNGTGSGDFYFHSDIPSGNYTLLVYTRWMRNFDPQSFFRQNIIVVNPQSPPAFNSSGIASGRLPVATSPQSGVTLAGKKTFYTTREKVDLTVNVKKASVLSVSVRVAEPLPLVQDTAQQQSPTKIPGISYLPDFRGELITGRVITNDGAPLARQVLSLSSPSKAFQYITTLTDSTGRFFFTGENIQSPSVYLFSPSIASAKFTVTVDDGFLNDYRRFTPSPLVLDTSVFKLINHRYRSMQVENAFAASKRDSVVDHALKPFYSNPDKRYRLDDYTRFTTMEDVFREIIPEVIVKLRGEKFSLSLRSMTYGNVLDDPLLLVDGIPVAEATIFMKYDPLLIESIDVITDRYFYGGQETNGIISVKTYTGDAKTLALDHLKKIDYLQPLQSKIYYWPTYERNSQLERVPDFRTQLFWMQPFFLSSTKTRPIVFYTNDLPGEYMIEIKGVTVDGETIDVKDRIVVTK